ncbi:NADH:flavin oxidoreductase [Blastomonas sp. AAP53]|uniref:NADH:flavin oxidoreductase n=1 Tax=Blastomonas sp. AAP53 TaxID=1248760 RepID=UPI0002F1EF38|nr:NADH:flavin oxidoreductase [Blastomonas sp. AAP53]
MPVPSLFSPCQIGALPLSSRLVMAPMTRRMSPGGVPGADVAAYYRKRAEGGVGLIISEGTGIADPAALAERGVPEFHGEGLAGWAGVLAAVHGAGGRMFPQLWHVGSARRPDQTDTPQVPAVSPSGLFAPDKPNGKMLDEARIAAIIAAFGDAAADARRLGFDGIELHAAHGYLIDQFFWGPTNRRTDIWGREPWRFAREIIAECRRRTAPDFPICLRFSQWKQQDYPARLFDTPQQLEAFVAEMTDAGTDIFHCSTRRFWEPEFADSRMNLAGWTRRLSGKPVITVGSVGLDEDFLVTRVGDDPVADSARLDLLEHMLATGEVDLVAVGRALIGDAQWGHKMRAGQLDRITPFTREALARLD